MAHISVNAQQDGEWNTVHTMILPPQAGSRSRSHDLDISPATQAMMNAFAPGGLYNHQVAALRNTLAGEHTCLATRTASVKSLMFYASALEHLVRRRSARILVLYPLKALGKEQEERWRIASAASGTDFTVGRIDGQVPMRERESLVRRSQVVIMTPDVVHAWLLNNLNNRHIRGFLGSLSLLIVDEVHTYSGVFGSNAAFLFRRLQHAVSLQGGSMQIIGASATISRPHEHLGKLFGVEFQVVDSDLDSSPRHELEISFMTPPVQKDFLTSLTQLLQGLASHEEMRFICFVDSRKMTEYVTSILSRRGKKHGDSDEEEGEPCDQEVSLDRALGELEILPFRAGYEVQDRERIQRRLTEGCLKGVVSASALELGIDIPHLNTAVLVGVPYSSTTLMQRIGRVGRSGPGRVIMVNSGDMHDDAIFMRPERIWDLPLAESSLYLENRRIQYIHALCLARLGGEHDQAGGGGYFSSEVAWPEHFIELCASERTGQIPPDLQQMKAEAGDDPNHAFPIRDVEQQFKVEYKKGPDRRALGSVSYSQMMREAYPGALLRKLGIEKITSMPTTGPDESPEKYQFIGAYVWCFYGYTNDYIDAILNHYIDYLRHVKKISLSQADEDDILSINRMVRLAKDDRYGEPTGEKFLL